MEPVRVKLYGLFPVTKRRYLRQLLATVVLLAALFGMWCFLPEQRPPRDGLPPHLEWALWFLQHLHWIALGLGMLVLVEAMIVLRRFAQAEASGRLEAARATGSAETTGTSPVARPESVNEGSG